MSREGSLIKNTAILAVGTFFPKIVAIITLPILTGYLTQTEYGYYDLISTLVSLLLPVATLQIQSAAFRFLIDCRGDREESSLIVNNIFIVTIPVTLIVLFFVFLGFGNLSICVRLAVCFYYFVDIIYLALQQITRGLSYNKGYSIATCVLSTVNLVLVIILVYVIRLGLLGVLLSLIISNVCACLVLIFWIRSDIDINIKKYASKQQIKKMLSYSWPMVPNNLSNWVLSVSDRLVITAFLGVEANAVYAVANKIPSLLSTVQGTFTLAWQENASISANDEDAKEYYSSMFDTLVRFLCSSLGCLIAFTPVIFALLISGDYDDAYLQMPVLFIGILFSCISSFLGGIYVAKKKIVSVGITTILAAIINLAVDFALVNEIGIWAGSISTLISYFFLMLFRMVDLHKKFGLKYNIRDFVLELLYICIASYICFMKNDIGNIVNCAVAIPIFFILNRKVFAGLWSRLVQMIRR
ncbi:MAG: oligosaccharide flippase family protein [Oscillospiraceae bacterium]|nr:oligosaccharide flippase family protein [Oscillospiraceae bacterium]